MLVLLELVLSLSLRINYTLKGDFYGFSPRVPRGLLLTTRPYVNWAALVFCSDTEDVTYLACFVSPHDPPTHSVICQKVSWDSAYGCTRG